MDPFTLALLGGSALASGGLSYMGSKQAAGAQQQAAQQSGMLGLLAQQQAAAQAQRMAEQGAAAGREFYGKGTGDVREFYGKGTQALEDYYGRGTGALADYYGRARGDVLGQAQQGEDIAREFYGRGAAAQAPYTTAGAGAVNRLAELFGVRGAPTGGDFSVQGAPDRTGVQGTPDMFGSFTRQPTLAELQMDPGYAFRLAQGQQAMQSTLGSSGMRGSGAALKAATRYGQEAGSQEYQSAYNRFMANRAAATQGLQNIAGTGAGAAGTVSNLSGSMGNALAGNRFTTGANLGQAALTTGGNIGQGAFSTGANLGQAASTTGANLGNLSSNAGGTVAGAYTGAIPTMAALTSANPYGQAMENVGQARASGYVGGTTALGNALNSGMGNALAYTMMNNMYPQGPSGSYQFGGQNVPYFNR